MLSGWMQDLLTGVITVNQIFTAGIAITAFSLFLYALSFNLKDRVARSFAIILLCVVSRAIAIPIYLVQLELIDFIDPSRLDTFNTVSKYFLYISGLSGSAVILFNVFRAYIKKKKVYATIIARN